MNIPFLPHSHECLNCTNRKNPQFVFNSTLLTIGVISISFVVSFALNQALKETFEQMFPGKDQELSTKWNYFAVAIASAIIIVFLLMYNLDGQKW